MKKIDNLEKVVRDFTRKNGRAWITYDEFTREMKISRETNLDLHNVRGDITYSITKNMFLNLARRIDKWQGVISMWKLYKDGYGIEITIMNEVS